jgi:hypothetical protein
MRVLICMLFVLSPILLSRGTDWPKDFVVHGGTQSPDGTLGILVPTLDAGDGDGPNYLADLQKYGILGVIKGGNYQEHELHGSLTTAWSSDSTICLADYGARDCSPSLAVLVVGKDRGTFTQLDIGDYMEKELKAACGNKTANSDGDFEFTPYYRVRDDHRIRFWAVSTTNPRDRDDVPTRCALFQGAFDVGTGKWRDVHTREISPEDADVLYRAFDPTNEWDVSNYPDAKTEFDDLDRLLNDVYEADRLILPEAPFAQIKAHQIAWLKVRDATPSLEVKNLMTRSRIVTLKGLFW